MNERRPRVLVLLSALFLLSVGFAYVESSVVVYLRALFYPGGFSFPLRPLPTGLAAVEVAREAATVLVLGASGFVAGSIRWERFGFFLFAFGVWDIFYYVWLKVLLDWPNAIDEWDVLFLIPLPWIGPVISPILIAVLMTLFGVLIVLRLERGHWFKPDHRSWVLSLTATGILLYSLMSDLSATLGGEMPKAYPYWMLITGILLYTAGFVAACRPRGSRSS